MKSVTIKHILSVLILLFSGYNQLSAHSFNQHASSSLRNNKGLAADVTNILQSNQLFFGRSSSSDTDFPIFENVEDDEIISSKKYTESNNCSTSIFLSQTLGCFFNDSKKTAPLHNYFSYTTSSLYLTFQVFKI